MMKSTKYIKSLLASAVFATAAGSLSAGQGAQLFKDNCAACHGVDGHPTTLGETLHAPDILQDPFKKGYNVQDIAKTLETGIAGTGKASFSYLSAEERLILAEYVYELRNGQGSAAQSGTSTTTQITAAPIGASAVTASSTVVKPKSLPSVVAKPKVSALPVTSEPAVVAGVASASKETLAKVNEVLGTAPAQAVVGKFDPVKAAKGAELYKKFGCASCHGDTGKADSPMGQMIKARNLVADEYKMGATFEGISGVLQNGLAGTAMAAFPNIQGEDRDNLVHFILSLKYPGEAMSKGVAPAAPAAPVKKAAVPATSAPVAVASTPAPVAAPAAGGESELITLGRKVYKKNGCASCHGEDGQAGTPTGKMLKARNFVIGDYKMGASVEGISGVLQNGLAGTAMAAFPNIKGKDLEALATFLLALKDNPELAADPAPKAATGGSGQVSIAFAMEKMAEHVPYPHRVKFDDGSAGAKIYKENCASCHGDNGQGGIATRMVSAAPYYRVETTPLLGHDGDWMKEAAFKKIVTEGTPGKVMPGLGTLTKQELNDLYDFFKSSLEKASK
jgi:mono/diheme cytochrome c family protein